MRPTFLALIFLLSRAAIGADAVPVQFLHDRVFIDARAPDGLSVGLYTDSGGGFNAVTESAAKRFALKEIGKIESGFPANHNAGRRPILRHAS